MRSRPGWGELWWVDLPGAARRPVLVLTRPEAVDRLPRILVAPATTRVRGLPSEVSLDQADGVPRSCVLNLDTPELLAREHFVAYIATLAVDRWYEVCGALERAVNCA